MAENHDRGGTGAGSCFGISGDDASMIPIRYEQYNSKFSVPEEM